MVKILIIEDDNKKFDAISVEVERYFGAENISVDAAAFLAEAINYLAENRYDLIVADIMLPMREGTEPVDTSEDIIHYLVSSEKNSTAILVGISRFGNLVDERRQQFVNSGILLIQFDEQNNDWKASFDVCLQRVQNVKRFDFAILCALGKERTAYRSADCEIGDLSEMEGLDCLEIKIGDLNGVIVKMPKMGLVDATVTAMQTILCLSPKILCMSGICAGFSQESAIGELLISDPCWEHQAGKWKAGDVFGLEHYHIGLENSVRLILSQFIEKNNNFEHLKHNQIDNKNIINQGVSLAPTVTGSAVIASKEKIEEINKQHRKLAGLDMEMYGMYRACDLSISKPICFGAKTVVDLADESKGDSFHTYGSVLSARFVVEAIKELHEKLVN